MKSITYLFVSFAFVATVLGDKMKVRLVNGPSLYEGRLEVSVNATWGSVCDDNWMDAYCVVVCRQLNFYGGKLIQGTNYGTTHNPIMLDDVICTGVETSLDQCMMSYKHNCDHTEDVGCRCDAPQTAVRKPVPNVCDPARYRIRPVSTETPWIGRVEIRSDDSSGWQVVCDDHWTDVEAEVFCHCLGYNRPFYAFSSPGMGTMLPRLSMAYDWVKCKKTDVGSNINRCSVVPASGRCLESEAAGVSCGPLHKSAPVQAPSVTLSCDDYRMTACFTCTMYTLRSKYLSLTPSCAKARRTETTEGACYDIDMRECRASIMESDSNHKHYCYDITYSQYDTNPEVLLTDPVWNRRACCSIFKNGTLSAGFSPLIPLRYSKSLGITLRNGSPYLYQASPIYKTYEEESMFTITCYSDNTFKDSILASDTLIRGQDVFCKVSTLAWDENMLLVVPYCQFSIADPTTSDATGKPHYVFIRDKCPLTDALDLSFYAFGNKHWGFKFQMPKFQGYDELYLTCSAYVCDEKLDPKPYCDRSCIHDAQSGRTRSKRSTTSRTQGVVNDEVSVGPFKIRDDGFGPLIRLTTNIDSAIYPEVIRTPRIENIPKTNQAAHHTERANATAPKNESAHRNESSTHRNERSAHRNESIVHKNDQTVVSRQFQHAGSSSATFNVILTIFTSLHLFIYHLLV